jgi:hypothetical protein
MALFGAMACHGVAQNWTFVKIDPKATYLRDSQFAPSASKIDLGLNEQAWNVIRASLGSIGLEVRSVGWFNRASDNPLSFNISNQGVGVFSVTGGLDPDWSRQYRVDAPRDAGENFFTLPTWVGGHATDIAEDFGIGPEVVRVPIPDGSRFVLLTPFDNGFWNNTDDFTMPGADPRGFGVEWRFYDPVPEPATALALGASVAIAALRRSRRRT